MAHAPRQDPPLRVPMTLVSGTTFVLSPHGLHMSSTCPPSELHMPCLQLRPWHLADQVLAGRVTGSFLRNWVTSGR